ncbi:response regulator [Thermodesulfobacteriota bacterium]
MDTTKILEGKRVLAVDDEEDILSTLIELLDMCKIDSASSFEEGKSKLESETYDLAVLDIMGVEGFELLEIANKQKVPALMLTAHALSEESLKKSAEEGAAYYAPKDEISNIAVFATDVLESIEENKNPWVKWFDRLGGFYDKKFHGPDWREQQKEFWDKRLDHLTGF